jgi:hypothetical protein
LNNLHFEFRGGVPAGYRRYGVRTRREDHAARSTKEGRGSKE